MSEDLLKKKEQAFLYIEQQKKKLEEKIEMQRKQTEALQRKKEEAKKALKKANSSNKAQENQQKNGLLLNKTPEIPKQLPIEETLVINEPKQQITEKKPCDIVELQKNPLKNPDFIDLNEEKEISLEKELKRNDISTSLPDKNEAPPSRSINSSKLPVYNEEDFTYNEKKYITPAFPLEKTAFKEEVSNNSSFEESLLNDNDNSYGKIEGDSSKNEEKQENIIKEAYFIKDSKPFNQIPSIINNNPSNRETQSPFIEKKPFLIKKIKLKATVLAYEAKFRCFDGKAPIEDKKPFTEFTENLLQETAHFTNEEIGFSHDNSLKTKKKLQDPIEEIIDSSNDQNIRDSSEKGNNPLFIEGNNKGKVLLLPLESLKKREISVEDLKKKQILSQNKDFHNIRENYEEFKEEIYKENEKESFEELPPLIEKESLIQKAPLLIKKPDKGDKEINKEEPFTDKSPLTDKGSLKESFTDKNEELSLTEEGSFKKEERNKNEEDFQVSLANFPQEEIYLKELEDYEEDFEDCLLRSQEKNTLKGPEIDNNYKENPIEQDPFISNESKLSIEQKPINIEEKTNPIEKPQRFISFEIDVIEDAALKQKKIRLLESKRQKKIKELEEKLISPKKTKVPFQETAKFGGDPLSSPKENLKESLLKQVKTTKEITKEKIKEPKDELKEILIKEPNENNKDIQNPKVLLRKHSSPENFIKQKSFIKPEISNEKNVFCLIFLII